MAEGVERTYRLLTYRFRVEASTGAVADELHRHLRLLHEDDGTGDHLPRYRLTLEDGDYVASAGERRLVRHTGPALPATELISEITREAIPTIGDRLAFHAGSVGIDGAGVMLPGVSGSGKSTLVAALVFQGATYLSDEVAALRGSLIDPAPRPLSLKAGSVLPLQDLGLRIPPSPLGDLDLGQRFVALEDLRPGPVGEACRLELVVFPTYQAGAATSVEPVSRGQGVMDLIRNCFNPSLLGAGGFESLGETARGARFYRLRSGDLAAAAATVRSLVSQRSG